MTAPQSSNLVRSRILVVDDDPAVLRALQFSLELDGFAVEAFESGAALIDKGDLSPPACLVLDYHLPEANGLDLLDDLRSRHVGLPAVLITSHPSRAVRARADAAGVEIVEKPLLSNALVEAVNLALAQPGGADLS